MFGNCRICKKENVEMAKDPRGRILKTCTECRKRQIEKCCRCKKELTEILRDNKGKIMNTCRVCFNHSFASKPKSKYWSKRNLENPRDLALNDMRKYWFDCEKCNSQFLSSLSCINSGTWCPFCKNKTEKIVFDLIFTKYEDVIRQSKFEWCKNQTYLPFDFYIPFLNLIIELDGEQHFEQISNWKKLENNIIKDKLKMNKALENNISIIRIYRLFIVKNFNWKENLLENIKKYDEPTVIFIPDNEIYNKHR